MSLWTVVVLGLGVYVLRLTGLSLSPQLTSTRGLVLYMPPAIIAGLVAVQTASLNGELTIDARLPGVVVAGAIGVLRGSLILAVLGGMATTALIRYLSIAAG